MEILPHKIQLLATCAGDKKKRQEDRGDQRSQGIAWKSGFSQRHQTDGKEYSVYARCVHIKKGVFEDDNE